MNDNQKLECYCFCRREIQKRIQINNAQLAFLEELEFWNDLAMIIKDYDVNEGYSLLNWVGDVLKVNYPDYVV